MGPVNKAPVHLGEYYDHYIDNTPRQVITKKEYSKMAHRLDRLCHTLETKGPQEASLLLVDTLLSDMNRAADKFENAADRQVITNLVREYDSYKGRLLDAVHHVEVVLSDVTPKDQVIHPAPVRDTYQQTAPSRVRSGR